MKNIITTAALLAAGTFALNAETTLVASFDSFTSLTQQSKEGNNTLGTAASQYNPTLNGDGTITFSNGDNVLFLSSVNGNLGSAFGNAGISVTMTVSNLSFVSSKTNALFTFHAKENKNNIEGVALTSDNRLKGIWNGNVWGDNRNTPVFIAGKDKFTLTLTQTSITTKLYIDGAHAATWSGLGSWTTAQITQYNIGNTSAGNQGTAMTLHNLYFHSGALDEGGVRSFYNTQVIPEPSSFGLLAGLGALALVGARRRRSRK